LPEFLAEHRIDITLINNPIFDLPRNGACRYLQNIKEKNIEHHMEEEP
jgi:hypothetical protein